MEGGRQEREDKKVDKTIVYGQGCFLRTIFHPSRRMCSTCVVIGRCCIEVQGSRLQVSCLLGMAEGQSGRLSLAKATHRAVCVIDAGVD